MARRGNFKFLDRFSHYTPGVGGMFALLAWLLLGAVLGSIASLLLTHFAGEEAGKSCGTLISYPIMFIPPMLYAAIKSNASSMNGGGWKLDSSHFGSLGGALCALLAMAGTIALGFWADGLTSLLPEMPPMLKETLEGLTEGNFLLNFIAVSIFAPVCEEWLCRGMVLRGLLKTSRISPFWAIVISAVFFALIHLNPWQAVPAFLIGCLLGLVYWRTGSLRLTMLMHFTNNTFALICGHLDALKDMESWTELMGVKAYTITAAACFLLTCLVALAFRKIPVEEEGGNMDKVSSIFETNEN